MIIKRDTNGKISLVKASARDTYDWANTPGKRWPCSSLSGHRFVAVFETNGDLVDFTLNGRDGDVDCEELNAFLDDMAGHRG